MVHAWYFTLNAVSNILFFFPPVTLTHNVIGLEAALTFVFNPGSYLSNRLLADRSPTPTLSSRPPTLCSWFHHAVAFERS